MKIEDFAFTAFGASFNAAIKIVRFLLWRQNDKIGCNSI
jgi:hypothetical protein